ncbi:MAG: hypothetical protein IJG80_03025 [Selenomonadaceae bacterium]|nr:hypothetical protein [Selenomonadaceae bacterium]MBQ3726121.1 hypothetical protein [Selenomonadaceae bacterium]MBQ9498079.1 hypothetical protein [Selenomonadaceae bacterium]
MKKVLTVLMLAAMVLSVGCGNKVEEAKQEAASEVQEAAADVKDAAAKVEQKAAEVTGNAPATATVDEKFSLGGVSPGMSVDEAEKILGTPTAQLDDDEFTFANGLTVDVEMNAVEEIKIRQAGVKTGAGVEVGMTEQNMIDAYGPAEVTENDDGVVEHKYYSGDRRIKLKFDVSNGTIVEIKCSLRD